MSILAQLEQIHALGGDMMRPLPSCNLCRPDDPCWFCAPLDTMRHRAATLETTHETDETANRDVAGRAGG